MTTADFLNLGGLNFMKRVPLYPSIQSGPTLTQQTGQQNVVYYNVNQNGRVRFGQISPGSNIPQRVDKIEFVTQGTVFGVRDTGGDWTFYCQKRVSAIYYHNRNRYKPFVKSDYVAIGHRMYPHEVEEFWPGGAGHVIMRH